MHCGLEIKKRPARQSLQIEERGESREKREEGCTLADGSRFITNLCVVGNHTEQTIDE